MPGFSKDPLREAPSATEHESTGPEATSTETSSTTGAAGTVGTGSTTTSADATATTTKQTTGSTTTPTDTTTGPTTSTNVTATTTDITGLLAKVTATLSTMATTETVDTAVSSLMSTGILTTGATTIGSPSQTQVTAPMLVEYGAIDPSAYIAPATTTTGNPTLVYTTTDYSTMGNPDVIITDVPDEGDNRPANIGSFQTTDTGYYTGQTYGTSLADTVTDSTQVTTMYGPGFTLTPAGGTSLNWTLENQSTSGIFDLPPDQSLYNPTTTADEIIRLINEGAEHQTVPKEVVVGGRIYETPINEDQPIVENLLRDWNEILNQDEVNWLSTDHVQSVNRNRHLRHVAGRVCCCCPSGLLTMLISDWVRLITVFWVVFAASS